MFSCVGMLTVLRGVDRASVSLFVFVCEVIPSSLWDRNEFSHSSATCESERRMRVEGAALQHHEPPSFSIIRPLFNDDLETKYSELMPCFYCLLSSG